MHLRVLRGDNAIVALDDLAKSYPTMLSIIAGGDAALASVRAAADAAADAERTRRKPLNIVRDGRAG